MRLYNRLLVIHIFSLSLIGTITMSCQPHFQGKNYQEKSLAQQSENTIEADISPQVNEIHLVEQDAEQAMQQAKTLMDHLFDQQGQVTFATSASGQTEPQSFKDVVGNLDQAFLKVIEFIEKIDNQLDLVRQKILDSKAKLDPNNPVHAALIAKIDLLIKQVDAVEERIDLLLKSGVSRIDQVLAKLDQFKSKLNPLNPVHIITLVVVEKVRTKISEFRDKLVIVINK